MDYIALSDQAVRQNIDALTVFTEFVRVQALAAGYAGGMYWKRHAAREYLVKTAPDNRQQRLGLRTPESELIFQEFMRRKRELEERLASLRLALKEAERLNKALKVGRVPTLVVSLLHTLEKARLGEFFTVVGTHALYAYEAAAGVRILPGALATRDVDLLWDARKRVQFMTELERLDTSILGVLLRVDATFERKEGQLETAINAKGFEVDFLRRQPVDDDPHPFRFSANEDDLWPVQAVRAAVLTSAPQFEQVVTAANGQMALMRTVSPQTFVAFKRWMAAQVEQRAPFKRQRDLKQAQIVQDLLDANLLT
ncbi:MAG: GSU2403 family nucleotidyltransferase fold protein [Burkholderiales bacterium]